MVKRAAKRAGVNAVVCPHWLRHAHGSHVDQPRGKPAGGPETLGDSNISTTSGWRADDTA
jgi:site-specific recombinase XerC